MQKGSYEAQTKRWDWNYVSIPYNLDFLKQVLIFLGKTCRGFNTEDCYSWLSARMGLELEGFHDGTIIKNLHIRYCYYSVVF